MLGVYDPALLKEEIDIVKLNAEIVAHEQFFCDKIVKIITEIEA